MRTKLGVVAWNPQPGQALPVPLLADDSASYDDRTVREVRAWLESVRDGFDARRPSHTVISLHRPFGPGTPIQADVIYGVGLDCAAAGECVTEMRRFRTTTVEFCCEKDPILARYRYLCAIDDSDLAWPKFILGPCLGVLPGAAGTQVVVPVVEQVMVAR